MGDATQPSQHDRRRRLRTVQTRAQDDYAALVPHVAGTHVYKCACIDHAAPVRVVEDIYIQRQQSLAFPGGIVVVLSKFGATISTPPLGQPAFPPFPGIEPAKLKVRPANKRADLHTQHMHAIVRGSLLKLSRPSIQPEHFPL